MKVVPSLLFILMFYQTLCFSQKDVSASLSKIWTDAPNQFKNFRGELLDSSDEFDKYKGNKDYKFAQLQVVENKIQNVASFFVTWSYNDASKAYVDEEVQKCSKKFQEIATQKQLQIISFGKEATYSFTALEKKDNLPVFTIVNEGNTMLLLITDVLFRKQIATTTPDLIDTSSPLLSNFNLILEDATHSFEKIRTTLKSNRSYDTTIYNINQGIFNDDTGHIVRYEGNYSFVLNEYFEDEYYYSDYFPIGHYKEQQLNSILIPYLEQLAEKNNWKVKKYAKDKLVKDQINGVIYYDSNKEKILEYYENTRSKSKALKVYSKINPVRDFTYKGAIILYQKNIGGTTIANVRVYHITDVVAPDYELLKSKVFNRWKNPELIEKFEFRANTSQQSVMKPFLGSKLNVVEYDIDAQGNDR